VHVTVSEGAADEGTAGVDSRVCHERARGVTEGEDASVVEGDCIRLDVAAAGADAGPDDRVVDTGDGHGPRVAAAGPTWARAGAREIVLPCRPR
jgi:hypothetical protein